MREGKEREGPTQLTENSNLPMLYALRDQIKHQHHREGTYGWGGGGVNLHELQEVLFVLIQMHLSC